MKKMKNVKTVLGIIQIFGVSLIPYHMILLAFEIITQDFDWELIVGRGIAEDYLLIIFISVAVILIAWRLRKKYC